MSADTASIADDLLRNGYERWLRLEEAKAEVADDLKELMAELKGQGFTPKAVRESFRRVRDMDDTDKQEHDAIVELYVASLTRAHPAPAREKTLDNFGSYAEAKGGDPRGFLATLTDEQKAAALAYRGDDTHGFEPTQEQPVESATKQRVNVPPQHEGEQAGTGDLAQATVRNVGVTGGERPASSLGAVPSRSVPVAIPDDDVPAFLRKQSKPLRPLCQHPDNCAGYGSHTCHGCKSAARELEPS